jgi:hypothetical protein
MATEKHLIYKEDLLDSVLDHFGCDLAYFGEDLQFCQEAIDMAPAVKAVEIPDAKLLRAVKMLLKQYEHSKNSEYVHSPVAHAFYHTWKQLDERRG